MILIGVVLSLQHRNIVSANDDVQQAVAVIKMGSGFLPLAIASKGGELTHSRTRSKALKVARSCSFLLVSDRTDTKRVALLTV